MKNGTRHAGNDAETGLTPDFRHPIPLPDGCKLITPRDTGHYVAALPKVTQSLSAWQSAAEMLLNAAERGSIVMPGGDRDAARAAREAGAKPQAREVPRVIR